MQLNQWPRPVKYGQFTHPKSGGGKRLAGLMREQTLRVEPENTLECPAPRGQIGTRVFYRVAGETSLYVAYVHADAADMGEAEEMDRVRFVFCRGSRALTFSPDTLRTLVVGEDERSLSVVLREQGDGADDDVPLGAEATPGGLPPPEAAAPAASPAPTDAVQPPPPAEAATHVGAEDDGTDLGPDEGDGDGSAVEEPDPAPEPLQAERHAPEAPAPGHGEGGT